MPCHHCHHKEATFFLTQVINGQSTELHLCPSCVEKLGGENLPSLDSLDFSELNPSSAIADLLMGLGLQEKEKEGAPSFPPCPRCGRSKAAVEKKGRLGCDHCYGHFEEQVELLLAKMQDGERHVGKVPKRLQKELKVRVQRDELEKSLQEALAQEDYYRAASLRDALQEKEVPSSQELSSQEEEASDEEGLELSKSPQERAASYASLSESKKTEEAFPQDQDLLSAVSPLSKEVAEESDSSLKEVEGQAAEETVEEEESLMLKWLKELEEIEGFSELKESLELAGVDFQKALEFPGLQEWEECINSASASPGFSDLTPSPEEKDPTVEPFRESP